MGNDPGKALNSGETSRIVIDIKGPFPKAAAEEFKKALQDLLEKYKGTWGDYNLPIAKPK